MKVRDLSDQTSMDRSNPRKHFLLYCPTCGLECSANSGDYFLAPLDTVLECCEEPMILVTKRTIFEEVD